MVGATGMCLGGHLAFRAGFDERVKAVVCYFATGACVLDIIDPPVHRTSYTLDVEADDE